MSHDDFRRRIAEMPEPKLELVDGRFSVGNGVGNLQLLRHLVSGWSAAAAVPFAPATLWWQALRQGFQRFDPPGIDKPLSVWRAWASQLTYAPELPAAGPMIHGKHRETRSALMMNLFGLGEESSFAVTSGGDVVMRLGQDALTPDVFAVGPSRCATLNNHYLNGPADLVIGVLLPGHENYDRVFKRQRYEAGGVREYWLVNPENQTVDFLHLAGHAYQARQADADGLYRSPTFPGLAFSPAQLWQADKHPIRAKIFRLEGQLPSTPRGFTDGGVSWGDLPFEPGPGLEPGTLSFDEFMAWAPQAKFEVINGKPWIGGSRGSFHTLGMLLRTEGLARAVTVLHPRDWIAALIQAEEERGNDSTRREHWWHITRQAAQDLRDRFDYKRLVVIGDLVHDQPPNLWSMITLVAFDLPKEHDSWKATEFLYKKYRDEPDINLIEHEHATRTVRNAVLTEGVEV